MTDLTHQIDLFVTCPKGIENLLLEELASLGVSELKDTAGGVKGKCTFQDIYRICLYSRLSNRVIWVLKVGEVSKSDDIYGVVKSLPWYDYFDVDNSLAVDFRGGNRFIKHTHYGALVIKDAVVDQFYEKYGRRPDVNPKQPDTHIYAHLKNQQLTLGIDVSGGSLHKRGYRVSGARAPLKENLAAALVKRARIEWQDTTCVVDPFCGSGTLLIEAFYQHYDLPSNLMRPGFGFEKLSAFSSEAWEGALNQARSHRDSQLVKAKSNSVRYYGYDKDGSIIREAKNNIAKAGLDEFIDVKQQALKDLAAPVDSGYVLTNPPYGERLDEKQKLFPLYKQFGEILKQGFQGWKAAVLCSEDVLLKALGLKKEKQYKFHNGALNVFWQTYDIHVREEDAPLDDKAQAAIDMVANRLRKNRKRLEKWANKSQVSCYRVYDADMPEYAFSLDRYGDLYQFTEYKAPKKIDPFAVMQRRSYFEAAVKEVFELKDSQLYYKERKRQKGKSQYEKLESSKSFFVVEEGQAKLMVNLVDYLDTGLFLDHRPVRKMIFDMAQDKRFLNLFCYTSAASVHAALGGASSTLSVDMSNTYLEWSERNFRKNRLDKTRHKTFRADVTEWVKAAKGEYDLIFLDPPSFSNSKKMEGTLDIQRDHRELISGVMNLLSRDGTLIFSNNLRGFKLDPLLLDDYDIKDISAQTIDLDFERNSKIHQCWTIKHKNQE